MYHSWRTPWWRPASCWSTEPPGILHRWSDGQQTHWQTGCTSKHNHNHRHSPVLRGLVREYKVMICIVLHSFIHHFVNPCITYGNAAQRIANTTCRYMYLYMYHNSISPCWIISSPTQSGCSTCTRTCIRPTTTNSDIIKHPCKCLL